MANRSHCHSLHFLIKTKLVSSTLQTVVVQLLYFSRFITRRILWNITPNTLSCTSVLLMTFLPSGVGPKVPSWNSLTLSTVKLIESNLLIVLAKVTSLFWICFSLQFSTFQKPPNKYLYIPESFHPSSNKKAFIKGELRRYVRNRFSFNSFYETRKKFWKRLRVRGYPYRFLLPLFGVKYDTVTERNGFTRSVTTFNCGHARIKNVISTTLPELDCIVCYKKTVTLANLCKLFFGAHSFS